MVEWFVLSKDSHSIFLSHQYTVMIRVANTVEKNVHALPTKVITVAAATATDVLPAINGTFEEYCARYVFNDSGSAAYYQFDANADNVESYAGKLQDQQQLDCSNHGGRVSIYSVAGGKFALTVLKRDDLHNASNIKINGYNT